MEAADELSDGNAPEITSRLIRQRLGLAKINNEEAKDATAKVLSKTTGFDLHLVVSEAFNIGIHASDPVGMADLIQNHLPNELSSVSYVFLNNARLKMMGNSMSDWDKGKQLYFDGLAAFTNEAKTARWYKHSAEEIGKFIEDQPDIRHAGEKPLMQILGKSPTSQEFARKYGPNLTMCFMRLGILDEFVDDIKQRPSELEALRHILSEMGDERGDVSEEKNE